MIKLHFSTLWIAELIQSAACFNEIVRFSVEIGCRLKMYFGAERQWIVNFPNFRGDWKFTPFLAENHSLWSLGCDEEIILGLYMGMWDSISAFWNLRKLTLISNKPFCYWAMRAQLPFYLVGGCPRQRISIALHNFIEKTLLLLKNVSLIANPVTTTNVKLQTGINCHKSMIHNPLLDQRRK